MLEPQEVMMQVGSNKMALGSVLTEPVNFGLAM